jgi:hypothetical protein
LSASIFKLVFYPYRNTGLSHEGKKQNKNKKQNKKLTRFLTYEAESSVDDLTPAHAAAIVEAHPRGATERVTCKDDFLSALLTDPLRGISRKL